MSRAPLGTILALQFKVSPVKTGLLSVLALVLVGVLAYPLTRGPRSVDAALVPGFVPLDPTLVPPTAAVSASKPRPPRPVLPDTPVRDPFEADWSLFARVPWVEEGAKPGPREDAPETAPALTLELTLTTVTEGGRPCAVVSGKTLRVGEGVGGFVVESIAPGEVVLTRAEGERMVLRMN